MGINFEQGVRRILILISAFWILLILVLMLFSISSYSPLPKVVYPSAEWDKYKVQKPSKFVDTIAQEKGSIIDEFLREDSDAKKLDLQPIPTLSDKIFGFISDSWLSIIGFLFIPIALLWSGYYSIKWIIAGFQNK